MAATAAVKISGTINDLPNGQTVINGTFSSSDASGQSQWVVLASGPNTITVPASPSPVGVIIKLPATNTNACTLKGVTGDTGVAMGKTGYTVLNWESGNAPTSFCITSAGAQTGLATQITFI